MTLIWVFLVAVAAIVAVATIVDVVRRHYSGWATAGWIVLVLILPFIGSLIYWFVRPAPPGEAEAQYLAQSDMRRSGRPPY